MTVSSNESQRYLGIEDSVSDLKGTYSDWHRHRAETEEIGKLKDPWHLTVARLMPDLNSLRVLEVGCGRGDFSIWLCRRYPLAEIIGVDFSDAAIEIARKRAANLGAHAQFQVEDAEQLSFANDSFDFVISCECLEHVLQPSRMATELRRVLRPGGRLILTTVNHLNGLILYWLQTWLLKKPYDSGAGVQPHENFFLFWRVKKILQRAGFDVEHFESNHFQWLLLPRTDPGKLATKDFANPFLKRIFRPFGVHFTFQCRRTQ